VPRVGVQALAWEVLVVPRVGVQALALVARGEEGLPTAAAGVAGLVCYPHQP